MTSRTSKWAVLPIAGILVILFYCAFTFTSIVLFPRPVSPMSDWLSDLGNSSYNPQGAIFYNVGCVLTGLALFPFFAGFYYWYTDEKWRKSLVMITQAVGFIAAFALMMIGVFSENAGAIHHLWSLAFFVSNLFVLILANVSLMTHRKFIRPIGYYGLIVAVINLLLVGLAYTSILEWFTVFTALGYVAFLSYNTFRASSS
ncbi:MAG: hypothetical protein ABSA81_09735 [Candidatus Bathyarchaeia archaeon]